MSIRDQKIGILTFHRAYNYGAVLQSYALQSVVNRYSDSEIIDYRCQRIEDSYFPKKSLSTKIKGFIKLFVKPKKTIGIFLKNKKYDSFRSCYLHCSPENYDFNSIFKANYYDKYISGSDQVWNFEITGGDLTYFLIFAQCKKKYSYAASFGNVEENLLSSQLINSCLMDFSYVSVREESGFNYVCNLLDNANVFLNCDPTMLLTKNEWTSAFKLKRKKRKKYLLVYFVKIDKKAMEFALNYSKMHNLKLIYISTDNRTYKDKRINNLYNVGPIDFLDLFYNASAIVTNSFHGIVFSLLFNRNFFIELPTSKENTNERLQRLIDLFSLKNIIDDNAQCHTATAIDWEDVNRKISELASESIRFIKEGIIYD